MEPLGELDVQAVFKVPPHREVGPPSVDYDPVSDSLVIHFFGPPEPAISAPVDDDPHVLLRLHMDEHYLVGVEFENFAASFLLLHPELIELARLAGVPAERLARVEREVSAERRRAAIVAVLREQLEESLVAVR